MVYKLNKGLNNPSKTVLLKQMIPQKYYEFLPPFSEAAAQVSLSYCTYGHKITLKEAFPLPFCPLYSWSRTELEPLQDWINDDLAKKFPWP